MNKGGLVTEVSRRTGMNKADVAAVVDEAMGVIRERVGKGERVSLVGFGTFEKKRRNKRIARNPRKPEIAIVVPARDLPSFIPGKTFKEAVSGKKRKPAAKKKSTRR
jgi:DNA-binding protein HU-beta